jgi:hypothetical protein
MAWGGGRLEEVGEGDGRFVGKKKNNLNSRLSVPNVSDSPGHAPRTTVMIFFVFYRKDGHDFRSDPRVFSPRPASG